MYEVILSFPSTMWKINLKATLLIMLNEENFTLQRNVTRCVTLAAFVV